jgi:hypothetical protein
LTSARRAAETIGRPPIVPLKYRDTPANTHLRDGYEHRYHELYSALAKSYVETSFAIRVPFFGFVVDANDFGIIGGFGHGWRFCRKRSVSCRLSGRP